MTPRAESWVLCDVAEYTDAPSDALRLSLGDSSDLTLDIEGIDGVLGGMLGQRFIDLLRIAAFVLGADGATGRGRLEDEDDSDWHRKFQMVVAVDDPDFWLDSGAAAQIQSTLSFLSQDSFKFIFKKREKAAAQQLRFSGPSGAPNISWDDIDHVALFSGGLDSFAGAAELLLNDKSKIILVSQRPATKVLNYQRRLVSDLADLAKERGLVAPRHVVVDVIKHKGGLRAEHTQRTRSFLYAAIAGATGEPDRARRDPDVREWHRGHQPAPIAASVIGARGTRTAHPRALLGFQKILSLVAGRPMKVTNPCGLLTRADVIERLAKTSALPLARHTISCAHVHKMSTMHPHCGACSQCIDRRFAFIGSGLQEHDPSDGYEHCVEADPWTDESARSLVLSWVGRAEDYGATPNADAFLDSFGEASRVVPPLMDLLGLGSDAANAAVFDLHKRHAHVVDRALSTMRHMARAAARTSEPNPNALSVLVARGLVADAGLSVSPRIDTNIANSMRRKDGKWAVTFRNGHPFFLQDSTSTRSLSRMLQDPGRVLTIGGLLDLDAGRQPASRPALGKRERLRIRTQIAAIEQERHHAQECCDETSAALLQTEIDALDAISGAATTPSRRESIVEQKLREELTATIEMISKLNPPMGSHLRDYLNTGAVCWYRRSGLHWDIDETPENADAGMWASLSTVIDKNNYLIRDAKQVAKFCDLHDVPTRRGRTKSGGTHPRRRQVHLPSFEEALRRQEKANDRLQNAADRAETERRLKSGELKPLKSLE